MFDAVDAFLQQLGLLLIGALAGVIGTMLVERARRHHQDRYRYVDTKSERYESFLSALDTWIQGFPSFVREPGMSREFAKQSRPRSAGPVADAAARILVLSAPIGDEAVSIARAAERLTVMTETLYASDPLDPRLATIVNLAMGSEIGLPLDALTEDPNDTLHRVRHWAQSRRDDFLKAARKDLGTVKEPRWRDRLARRKS